jgi:hypothetical protein
MWVDPAENEFGSQERALRGSRKPERECNGFSAKVENPSEKPF